MSLSSIHLEAFQAVAKSGSITQAVKLLNITQSALSQRIKNLEQSMGLTLFVRLPTGVLLTEQGERLLRYCQTKESLESELLHELNVSDFYEIAGTVRVGCYSSVYRSVVLPSLTPILKQFPKIKCEFTCAEMWELPEMLQRAEVDFIVMDYEKHQANLEMKVLGKEKFVVIESKKISAAENIFLDNDRRDTATESFFKFQNKDLPSYKRSYFDDCYGIIDAVKAGLGRAVMSEHLVHKEKSLKVLNGFKTYEMDVVLYYHKQPYYSRLHNEIVGAMVKNSRKFLGVNSS